MIDSRKRRRLEGRRRLCPRGQSPQSDVLLQVRPQPSAEESRQGVRHGGAALHRVRSGNQGLNRQDNS
jgi:hypothetical protein